MSTIDCLGFLGEGVVIVEECMGKKIKIIKWVIKMDS